MGYSIVHSHLPPRVRLGLGRVRDNYLAQPHVRLHRLLLAKLGYCPLPDFLIIGAQKAGTSSLYAHLCAHDRIRRAMRKEVRFFDQEYSRGLTWYRAFFPPRGSLDTRLSGEATPNYLLHPLAPARVAETLPDVRLVAILRNPIERAFSHYQHALRFGAIEPHLTFEEALDSEQRLLSDDPQSKPPGGPVVPTSAYMRRSFVTRGVYVVQIRRWLERISPDRLLTVKFEDYLADSRACLERVLDFLHIGGPVHADPPHKNIGVYRSDMRDSTRAKLRAEFAPYNLQLAELVGIDVDDWS